MPETDWITMTNQDVLDRFNPDEQAALNALSGSDDSLTPLLTDVVQEVRGKIKAGGRMRGPDGTVPRSLKGAIVSIVIWEWLTNYSRNDKLQTEGRKESARRGRDELEAVAQGKQPVELPDAGNPADTVAAPRNSIALIKPSRRVQSKYGKDGTL